jgi:hypothetical protein
MCDLRRITEPKKIAKAVKKITKRIVSISTSGPRKDGDSRYVSNKMERLAIKTSGR